MESIFISVTILLKLNIVEGAQWLSGRVLDSIPRDRGFRRHCIVVLFFFGLDILFVIIYNHLYIYTHSY